MKKMRKPQVYDLKRESGTAFNQEKFVVDIVSGVSILFARENRTVLSTTIGVFDFIKQVSKTDFLISTYNEVNQNHLFQHLLIDEKGQKNIAFEAGYDSSQGSISDLFCTKDIVFLKKGQRTLLYNWKTRNKRACAFASFPREEEMDGKKYLYLEQYIDGYVYKDTLSMFLDQENLEAITFYSELQDRVIPIYTEEQLKKISHCYSSNYPERYKQTIRYEVMEYIQMLDDRKMEFQEEENNRIKERLKVKMFEIKRNQ